MWMIANRHHTETRNHGNGKSFRNSGLRARVIQLLLGSVGEEDRKLPAHGDAESRKAAEAERTATATRFTQRREEMERARVRRASEDRQLLSHGDAESRKLQELQEQRLASAVPNAFFSFYPTPAGANG